LLSTHGGSCSHLSRFLTSLARYPQTYLQPPNTRSVRNNSAPLFSCSGTPSSLRLIERGANTIGHKKPREPIGVLGITYKRAACNGLGLFVPSSAPLSARRVRLLVRFVLWFCCPPWNVLCACLAAGRFRVGLADYSQARMGLSNLYDTLTRRAAPARQWLRASGLFGLQL
jgi:hypothetical protein